MAVCWEIEGERQSDFADKGDPVWLGHTIPLVILGKSPLVSSKDLQLCAMISR